MQTQEIIISRHITKAEEKTYFLIPFNVPKNVARLDIRYSYERYITVKDGGWEKRLENNIVDLAVCGANNRYIGASGSDRTHIYISARESAQGYADTSVEAGEWSIVVGAYKVCPKGVDVTYTITFTMKERRLVRGDTHMHTLGSDGALSPTEIASMAKKNGLDYIFITDHNNYAHNLKTVEVSDITVMPGAEWTHYNGHMGMLGIKKPYENAFPVNSSVEAIEKIEEAQKNGAFLVLNHPFCPNCGWKWGFNVPYHAVEVWNGAVPEDVNDAAIKWWHNELCKGRRIPITGGSDFHRVEPNRMVGVPTTCLYADSTEPEDIMNALRSSRTFLSWRPDGTTVEACTDDGKGIGEETRQGSKIKVKFNGLSTGDRIYFITDCKETTVIVADGSNGYETIIDTEDIRFVRFEVRGAYASGLPVMRKLLSSPIYLTQG